MNTKTEFESFRFRMSEKQETFFMSKYRSISAYNFRLHSFKQAFMNKLIRNAAPAVRCPLVMPSLHWKDVIIFIEKMS